MDVLKSNMTQYEQLKSLRSDVAMKNVQAYYAQHFPYFHERSILHKWIDTQWQHLVQSNIVNEYYIKIFFESIERSRKDVSDSDYFLVSDSLATLKVLFAANSGAILEQLSRCLNCESKVISNIRSVSSICHIVQVLCIF